MSKSERWAGLPVQGIVIYWNLVSGVLVPGGEAGTLTDSIGGREPLKGWSGEARSPDSTKPRPWMDSTAWSSGVSH